MNFIILILQTAEETFTDKNRKAAGDGTVSTVQIPCSPDFLIFITGEIPDLPRLMWIDAETTQKREGGSSYEFTGSSREYPAFR